MLDSENVWFKRTTILIACIALWPILFPLSDMWDGDRILMHQMIGSTSAYDPLLPHGWYVVYWLRLLFHDISMLTGIPHKAITNILSVLSIVGIAMETYKYLRFQFNVSTKAAYVGCMAVLAYPIWHIMLSSVHLFYVLFLWAFMLAVNLRMTHKILSLVLFAFSLQYFSLFPFAIGFACVHFIMKTDRNNFIREGLKLFLFASFMLSIYLLLNHFMSLHGPTGKYNTLNLKEIESFIDFFFLSSVSGLIWYAGKRFFPQRYDWTSGGRLLLSFWVLVFFASFTYWAVGRPLRFFAFGSFTSRHTILNCIPFALLLATMTEVCLKSFSLKKVQYGVCFILLVLIVILNQGYSHKVAALLFKDMFVYALKEQTPPPSGYVGIYPVGYKPPRHVHEYSMNFCFYKAFGENAWMANGFWSRKLIPTEETLKKRYPLTEKVKNALLAFDITGNAYTAYDFKLDGYHQEGRFWYWYYYFSEDYKAFTPTLTLRKS